MNPLLFWRATQVSSPFLEVLRTMTSSSGDAPIDRFLSHVGHPHLSLLGEGAHSYQAGVEKTFNSIVRGEISDPGHMVKAFCLGAFPKHWLGKVGFPIRNGNSLTYTQTLMSIAWYSHHALSFMEGRCLNAQEKRRIVRMLCLLFAWENRARLEWPQNSSRSADNASQEGNGIRVQLLGANDVWGPKGKFFYELLGVGKLGIACDAFSSIDRLDPKKSKKDMERFSETLLDGRVGLIFPQGTRVQPWRNPSAPDELYDGGLFALKGGIRKGTAHLIHQLVSQGFEVRVAFADFENLNLAFPKGSFRTQTPPYVRFHVREEFYSFIPVGKPRQTLSLIVQPHRTNPDAFVTLGMLEGRPMESLFQKETSVCLESPGEAGTIPWTQDRIVEGLVCVSRLKSRVLEYVREHFSFHPGPGFELSLEAVSVLDILITLYGYYRKEDRKKAVEIRLLLEKCLMELQKEKPAMQEVGSLLPAWLETFDEATKKQNAWGVA